MMHTGPVDNRDLCCEHGVPYPHSLSLPIFHARALRPANAVDLSPFVTHKTITIGQRMAQHAREVSKECT